MPGPGGCLVPRGLPGPTGVSGPGGPGVDPPGRPLLRAVRILLECILVNDKKCILNSILPFKIAFKIEKLLLPFCQLCHRPNGLLVYK